MDWDSSLRVPVEQFPDPELDEPLEKGEPRDAVLAGGCFWCVDAVFRQLDGVLDVNSGYAGGPAAEAEYNTVGTGRTNHAEAVRVRYDPERATFGQLLKIHFSVAHDPTQLNRQGNDVGRQYRSAIFYANDSQKRVAEVYIRQLDAAKVFRSPIVTTLEPLDAYYEGEEYHQDFANRNPAQPYVAYAAAPKVEKVRKYFPERLKGAKTAR